jgi:hypothetical protein
MLPCIALDDSLVLKPPSRPHVFALHSAMPQNQRTGDLRGVVRYPSGDRAHTPSAGGLQLCQHPSLTGIRIYRSVRSKL